MTSGSVKAKEAGFARRRVSRQKSLKQTQVSSAIKEEKPP